MSTHNDVRLKNLIEELYTKIMSKIDDKTVTSEREAYEAFLTEWGYLHIAPERESEIKCGYCLR
jgi:hypothetical protein